MDRWLWGGMGIVAVWMGSLYKPYKGYFALDRIQIIKIDFLAERFSLVDVPSSGISKTPMWPNGAEIV